MRIPKARRIRLERGKKMEGVTELLFLQKDTITNAARKFGEMFVEETRESTSNESGT